MFVRGIGTRRRSELRIAQLTSNSYCQWIENNGKKSEARTQGALFLVNILTLKYLILSLSLRPRDKQATDAIPLAELSTGTPMFACLPFAEYNVLNTTRLITFKDTPRQHSVQAFLDCFRPQLIPCPSRIYCSSHNSFDLRSSVSRLNKF